MDGEGVDQWAVKKPAVLETRYVGQNVYESSYTIFTKQLDVAFSSPEEFAAFMSGLMTHFSNQREQYLEMLSRSILDNMIGAKKILADDGVNGPHVIDLLDEYNTATGSYLTNVTVRQPANYPAFCKWAYAYIQHVSDMFTERSVMFERPIDGFPILRHTPKADQRMFLDADFLAHMTAEVLADTYHDNFLKYTEVEAVNFWQSAVEPSTVKVKPVYLDKDAKFVNATDPVTVSGIVGLLMDRDAAGYNLADDSLVTSPYNAKGQYYNIFNHVRVQLQNDLTEKAVVFLIGAGRNPNPPVPSGLKFYDGDITSVEDNGVNVADNLSTLETISDMPESISVIFNGVLYELPAVEDEPYYFGDYTGDTATFENYPLGIAFYDGDSFVVQTEEAGTFSLTGVVPDGGGGGGEIPHATVTLTTTVDPTEFNTIYFLDNDTSKAIVCNIYAASGTYVVPISEGGCVWSVADDYDIATTGDISYDAEDYLLTITGDGTITVGPYSG